MSLVNSTSNTKIPTEKDTQNNQDHDSLEVKNSKRWSNQQPSDDLGPVLLPLRGEIAK